jgi:hypothetical protein
VWGDSLRAYGLSCVWNILAIGSIWKLLCEKPRLSHTVVAGIVAILSVHSMFPNAFFLFAAGLSGMAVAARHRWWRTIVVILGIGTLAAISLLPYAPIIKHSQDWTGLAKGAISIPWLLEMLIKALRSGGSVALTLWIVSAAAALAATMIGFGKSQRFKIGDDQRNLMIYAGLTFLIGGVCIVSFFRVVGWTTSIWYYVPLMATAAVCFDALLGVFRNRVWRAIGASVSVLVAFLFLFPIVYQATQVRLTNVDLISAEIASHADKSDLIVVDNYFYAISFNRYYHGQTPWISVPDLSDLSLHRWDLLTDQMRQPEPIHPVLEQIDRTLQQGHNVFVVGFAPTRRPSSAPPDLPPAPRSNSGWILWPYMANWTRQVAYAAESHAEHGMIISARCQQPVSIAEDLNAFVVSGWRD